MFRVGRSNVLSLLAASVVFAACGSSGGGGFGADGGPSHDAGPSMDGQVANEDGGGQIGDGGPGSCAPLAMVPGPTNTGVPAGTNLTLASSMTITTDNTVIDAMDITGTVTIAASGVVIKNSRIHGTGTYGVYVQSGDVTLMDFEIYGFNNGIAFDHWTAIRGNIHGMTEDGVKLGSHVLLQDSWCHDLAPSPGAHADCGQMQSGVVDLTVRHNAIDPANGTDLGNSALFIAPDLGPSSAGPVILDGNLLGGGNYSLYVVDGNSGQYYVSDIRVTCNHFLRDAQYGPTDINVPIAAYGNVWDDTGDPLLL